LKTIGSGIGASRFEATILLSKTQDNDQTCTILMFTNIKGSILLIVIWADGLEKDFMLGMGNGTRSRGR